MLNHVKKNHFADKAKLYLCPYCDISFKTQSDMKHHIEKGLHGMDVPEDETNDDVDDFEPQTQLCAKCARTFPNKNSLKRFSA